jgi:hypothetical protein
MGLLNIQQDNLYGTIYTAYKLCVTLFLRGLCDEREGSIDSVNCGLPNAHPKQYRCRHTY